MELSNVLFNEGLDKNLLELFSLTKSTLSYEKRKTIIERLIPYIVKKSSDIFTKSQSIGLSSFSSYEPGFEWDLMLTLQNILQSGTKHITYDSIITKKTRKRDLAYFICIDKSLSVFSLIHQIVLLAAVLSYASKGEDYSIVVFDSQARVLKEIREYKHIEKTIEEILTIESGGKTNIHAGLKASLQEMMMSRKTRNRLLLVTDFQKTAGKDPFSLLTQFTDVKLIYVRSHRDRAIINKVEELENTEIFELSTDTDLLTLCNQLLM